MKQIAIIGPTASGKSDLAITMALQHNAYILSIDSLSIYKEIDIASAKPSQEELAQVEHFGVNAVTIDQHFDVAIFIRLYQEVYEKAQRDGKNLIIVGGTSFYLKSLTSGLSELPEYSEETKRTVSKMLQDLPAAHAFLVRQDPEYMRQIKESDAYRIEKMLLLTLQSKMTPTQWFHQHPPQPVIEDLQLFNIEVARPLLRERIVTRTKTMIKMGLIDEIAALELKYGRHHNAMKAIGVIEVLGFLDGDLSKEEMIESIITHTAQLAKRQQTFNRTQFTNATSAELASLPERISQFFTD